MKEKKEKKEKEMGGGKKRSDAPSFPTRIAFLSHHIAPPLLIIK